MRRLRLFILGLCLICASAFCFCACDEKVEVSFSQESYQMKINDEVNALNFVKEEVSSDLVEFKSGNKSVVFVTPSKTLVALNAGQAEVYAYVNGEIKSICSVFVSAIETQTEAFSTPVNISYNLETQTLSWDKVYAQGDNGIIFASSYTVEITKDGVTREFKASNNYFGKSDSYSFKKGDYKIRIKADKNSSYLASNYQENYFEFSIMASPTNVSFDNTTKTLSWEDNANSAGTKYLVEVYKNDELIQTFNGIEEKYIIFTSLEKTNYRFEVKALPNANNAYASQSAKCEISYLNQTELTFNNGNLSWTKQANAKNYLLVLKKGSAIIESKTINSQNTYDFSKVDAGTYSVTVQAIGDSSKNVFDGEVSNEYLFTKLSAPTILFAENRFSVTNADGYEYSLAILNATQTNSFVKNSQNIIFDKTDFAKYTVSAKIFAQDKSHQIDSEETKVFKIPGSSNLYSSIQNLNSIELVYDEINGNAIVSFNEVDEGATYTLSKNGVISQTQAVNNAFNLGNVQTLFNSVSLQTIKVNITKTSSTTIYIPNSTNINIQKLSKPESIKINSLNSKVEQNGELILGASGLDIYVNDTKTENINLENSSVIKAKYNRTSLPQVIENIKTYFTSSDFSEFYITKLATPENLTYNYETGVLSWDSVQNATSYKVYKNNELIGSSYTSSFTYKVNGGYNLCVEACYYDLGVINAGEHKYVESEKSSQIEIIKLAQIKNLLLTKDETNIYLTWEKPEGFDSIQPAYDVFVDGVSMLEENQTLNEEEFTLPLSLFSEAKTYTIKVSVVDNFSYYFDTSNYLTVSLTKLPEISSLTNVKNILCASKIQNVQTQISALGFETSSSFDMSQLISGQEVEISAKYVAGFDSNGYYLENNATTYTIQKLNIPTNLDFENNQITWETADVAISSLIEYSYHFDSETANSTTTNTYIQNINKTNDCVFYVCETILEPWTTINTGDKKYISSTDFASLAIQKQNPITNVQVEEDENNVIISWSFEELENLQTTFTLSIEELIDTKTFAEVYNETLQRCIYSIDKNVFENAGDYELTIIATNNKSLRSDEKTLTITKLDCINNLQIDGLVASLLDKNQNAIEVSENYELDLDSNDYEITDLSFDLTNVIDIADISLFLKAINPVCQDMENYFLSSEKTQFTFTRIANPVLSFASEVLSWNTITNADFYTLKFVNGEHEIIFTTSDTTFDFNSSDALEELIYSGDYTVTIQSNKNTQIINSSNALIDSLFGSQLTINKLENAGDIEISVDESDITQTNVTLDWNEVTNATSYDVFVGTSQNDISTLISTVNTNTFTTNYFASTNTYYVKVIAKGVNYISSNSSNIATITRIAPIQNVYLTNFNSDINLCWETPISQNAYAQCYNIKVYDKDNVLKTNYENVALSVSNTYSLTNNDFIASLIDGNFKVVICLVGKGGDTNTASLSSAYTEITPYKFKQPTISVENGKIKITSADFTLSNPVVKFIYSIYSIKDSNRIDWVKDSVYTGLIEISSDWDANNFVVEAYAVPYANSSAYYNYVSSLLTTSETYSRIEKVTGVSVETTDTIIHDVVNIKWQPSENATGYRIIVNDEVVGTVPAGLNNAEFVVASNSNYFANTLFTESGSYSLEILAYSDETFVPAFKSDAITILRLNSIENLSMNQVQEISFNEVLQVQDDNPYYLELVSKTGKVIEKIGEDKTFTDTSCKFSGTFIDDLAYGTFYINVRVVGSGVFSENSIILTSNKYETECYKLKAPDILVTDEQTFVISSDESLTDKYKNVKHNYTIKTTPEISGVYSAPIAIQDSWEDGIEVEAYSTINLPNVVDSNKTSKSFARLESPTNLSVIVSDKNSETEQVKLTWTGVNNATSYTILINDNKITTSLTSCLITDYVKNAGEYTISIIANDFWKKISSLPSESITAIRLKPLIEVQIDKNKTVTWEENNNQLADISEYYYYLTLQNSKHSVQATQNVFDDTSYDLSGGFLDALVGGTFYISVQCASDEVYDLVNKKIILSSLAISTSAYKLYAPVCELTNNNTSIKITSTDDLYKDNILIYYSVKKASETIISEALYTGEIDIPDDWEAGLYTFTTWAEVKDGVSNLIDSNKKDYSFNRLDIVNNLQISSNTNQTTVTLSWASVANATMYDVFLDNVKVFENISSTSVDISTFVKDVGSYKFYVLAKADGKITSLKSQEITVIRLEEANDLWMNSSAVTFFDISNIAEINYFEASFKLLIGDSETTNKTLVNNGTTEIIDENNFDDFASYVEVLVGGEFEIQFQLIGSGLLQDGVATLSSNVVKTKVYKLYIPTISVHSSYLEVKSEHTSDVLSDESLEGNISKLLFTIKRDTTQDVLDHNGISIVDKVYTENFYYPEAWVAGEYTITTHSVVLNNDIRNVVNSNISDAVTTTRLTAPTDIQFERDIAQTSKYVSDVSGLTYLSDTIYFKFINTEYANGRAINYQLINVDSLSSQYITQTSLNVNEINDLINASTNSHKTVKMLAIASESGQFINSAPAFIEFNTIQDVASFTTLNGDAAWNFVQNSNAYLISTNSEDAYWQSDSGNTTTSSLQVLSDFIDSTGAIVLKIKALGNVSTSGTLSFDGEIYLDSNYTSSNFYKLETPSSPEANLGFMTFDNITYAQSYYAYVQGIDKKYLLGDYADFVENFKDGGALGKFIASCDELSQDLSPNTLYQIQIQAYGNNAGILSSKKSEYTNFKILEQVNLSSDLKIYCQNSNYNDSVLRLNLAKDSYGFLMLNGDGEWELKNTSSLANNATKSDDIILNAVVENNGIYFTKTIMQLGSSKLENDGENDFYFLNSLPIESNDFYQLAYPSYIQVVNGEITWGEVDGADGYYLYLNGTLVSSLLTEAKFDVPNSYGGDENLNYEVMVAAVATTPEISNTLHSLSVVRLTDDGEIFSVVKQQQPQPLKLSDGVLYWDSTDAINYLDEDTLNVEITLSNGATSITSEFAVSELLNDSSMDISEINDLNGLFTNSRLMDKIYNWQTNLSSGYYTLTIQQKGDNTKYLKSKTVSQEIYISSAPNEIKLVTDSDSNFFLEWSPVSVTCPSYAHNSDEEKYILYGENKDGERKIICRTSGNATSTPEYLSLNLTDLIDNDILTPDIKKLFIVVSGDDTKTVKGFVSDILDVTILNAVPVFNDNGYIMWGEEVDSNGYQLVAEKENVSTPVIYNYAFNKTDERSWLGDAAHGQADISNGQYTVKLRAVGSGNVITGKRVIFKIEKLIEMDVSTNKYGSFEWDKVSNAFGFAYATKTFIDDISYKYITKEEYGDNNVDDSGSKCYFVPNENGAFTYLFRTLGSNYGEIETHNIGSDLTLAKTYYVSSSINQNTDGINAENLPQIESIWVKDGLVCWNAIALESKFIPEIDTSNLVYGYKISVSDNSETINNIGVYYSTNLNSTIFSQIGNVCKLDMTLLTLDEEGVGISAGDYYVTISAYVYFETNDHSIETISIKNLTDEEDDIIYNVLIGNGLTITFTKIGIPLCVQVKNGRLVWDDPVDATGYQLLVSNVQTFDVSSTVEEIIYCNNEENALSINSFWPDENYYNGKYYIKLRAFSENLIYSNYVFYSTDNINPTDITKVDKLGNQYNAVSSDDATNLIQFDYSAIGDYGFNIKYTKSLLENEWIECLCVDENNELLSDLPYFIDGNTVSIDIAKLDASLSSFKYKIQVVPIGNKSLFMSNYTDEQTFSAPVAPEFVFYDSSNYEYYWAWSSDSKFMVKDEILDDDDNNIATYRYVIDGTVWDTPYIKQKDGISYVTYQPMVVGVKHRVSVAGASQNSLHTIVSSFTECEDLCELNLFETEIDFKDISLITDFKNYASEENPYLITTLDEYKNIDLRLQKYEYMSHYLLSYNDTTTEINDNKLSYVFELKNDLNLDNIVLANNGVAFANVFDGSGKTITNTLSIKNSLNKNLGIFANLTENGKIQNLNVNTTIIFDDANTSGNMYLGGIVAVNNGGQISNCQVDIITSYETSVLIKSDVYFGGIVGQNILGTIQNCVVNSENNLEFLFNNVAQVSGFIGGISGLNKGTISQCGNNANIKTQNGKIVYVGGVAGQLSDTSSIDKCFNKGTIIAVQSGNGSVYVGGLVGYINNCSLVSYSYNTGNVICQGTCSNAFVGGLVGKTQVVKINICYSIGVLTLEQGISDAAIGILFGYVNSTDTTNQNYYHNESQTTYIAIGNYNSETNFAQYISNFTQFIASNSEHFKSGDNYPLLIWE